MSEQEPERENRIPNEQAEHGEEARAKPRIYVASLSDYNAGRLHGAWLDVDDDAETLLAGISSMLAASPEPIAEEWAIHDYEGFGGARLEEHTDLESLVALARGIIEHGPAFGAFANLVGNESELLEEFEDCYRGQWASVEAYAEDLLDDFGLEEIIERAVPEGLRPYVRIDTEAFGRDLELGGDLLVVDDDQGGVFLFSPG